MARYFFNLRDGSRGYLDHTGVDLPSDDAAVDHARLVAAELVRNRERKTRHWRIDVQNEEGKRIFETALISQDRTLAHLRPPLRKLVEELGERCCALQETIAVARVTVRQSRALVARSRGRPHLAADRGELV